MFLGAFTGDVKIGGNVYQLDTTDLDLISNQALQPGRAGNCRTGPASSSSDSRLREPVLAHDPGRWLALIASVLVIVGVSMSLLLLAQV